MTTLNVTIPQELIDQQTSLTATLESIATEQAKLSTQKTEAEQSLRRIDTAIKFLRGEAIPLVKPEGARRPMSEQARANIKAGLLASAARKKAASAAPQHVETVPVAASAPATTPKPASAKRGAKA